MKALALPDLELLDDILARIVSGLPLKEAVTTCVLAKRWRYIWTFTKNLDFDAEETLNRIIESPRQLLRVERPKYIDQVNSVIAQRSSKNNMVRGIDRFRMGFDLCRELSSSIDNWIEVVEWLLSKCPLLERLKVAGSDKLINLRISRVPNLKHFEIRRCINIKKVEIYAAQNLVSDEDLGRTFTLLSSCLSQLQILHLDLLLQPHVWNLEYPTLTNLKHLKLTLSATENLKLLLSRIIPFLNVSPCLQRLELMMLLEKYFDERCGFVKQPTNCPVKEVEILGYSGHKNLDQLIIYFADNLVALQKIIVHPCASAHEKFNFDPAFR
ncbi:hypothetical protein FEM48_Zijuj02G0016700 [Ziziphus jujuba var. spinosa]|uniref:FBD domain-containing protein n=1 Tax=Ziziphus jujuba var. spinosa TaxID=714518 RepID=A0A978VSV9_ZIZJJ|nr:hypothetical protein FEM48_Zijuj02G0016700 [Ziziphus jujuba var. spinosa]